MKKLPYQDFWYNGVYEKGKTNTVGTFYSFNIDWLKKSVLDLGCNEGSMCLSAKQAGAKEVVGVERNDAYFKSAKKRASWTLGSNRIHYVKGEIVDYVLENDKRYDVVLMLAIIRHIHKYFMNIIWQHGRYLIYDSYQEIIKNRSKTVKPFNDFMSRCIGLANQYFITSFDDHSGLIQRNKEDVIKYFKGLTNGDCDIEVYTIMYPYTVVLIRRKKWNTNPHLA